VLTSSGGFSYQPDEPRTFMHGHWGDGGGETWQPIPGDYDGDGRHDVAIWSREDGSFWVLTSQGGFSYDAGDPRSHLSGRWGPEGAALYRPIPEDFDGDGRTDVAVWSKVDGQWRALLSSAGFRPDPLDSLTFVSSQLGSDGESLWVPLPADYDGDGLSDMGVWGREYGELYIEKASEGYHDFDRELGYGQYGRWGFLGDLENVPIAGHYSGLPASDLAAYHKWSGTFWVVRAGAGFSWVPLEPSSYMAVLF
jgi:hypothetical protein